VDVDMDSFKKIDKRKRKTIRSSAFAIGVSKSTLHRRILEGVIRLHSSALKPFLTEANKVARLSFCTNMIDPLSLNGDAEPRFYGQWNRVHIDEKWFYLTEASGSYYLAVDEDEPQRVCKSKKFIMKVMFLAAVARPRWDRVKNQWFTGLIGLWPLVYTAKAKRNSKNRPAGTPETKAIESVNKEVTKRFLIEKVFPAIRESWPRRLASNPECGSIEVFVQQDNARPHPAVDDPELLAEGDQGGMRIRMTCQPPNSPDLNVLDLGFFRAIQSLQYQHAPRNVDELISAVETSFYDMERSKLDKIFLTLQQCFIEVMKCGGGNNYKLPHMSKDRLGRQGALPETLTCPTSLYQSAKAHQTP
jgi:hypothetical protein